MGALTPHAKSSRLNLVTTRKEGEAYQPEEAKFHRPLLNEWTDDPKLRVVSRECFTDFTFPTLVDKLEIHLSCFLLPQRA